MTEQKTNPESRGDSAPFNMAFATLEKIHEILKQISLVSTFHIQDFEQGSQLTKGMAQHLKARLVRQLFVQSVPLINSVKDKEWKEEMNNKTKEASSKLLVIKQYSNCNLIGEREGYNLELENTLDDLTIEIQERLQSRGYFMPSKADPKYGWDRT